MNPVYRWIHRVWYEGAATGWPLLPLSALYGVAMSLRRFLYRVGFIKVHRASVPVIVVGNIAAGGTGKTPTVIWLARELCARGFSPGIVSRGYGGSGSNSTMRVDSDSPAALVGDEPVVLARRSNCPVAVDRDRVRAVEMLADDGVDLVITDDGLQHYRLGRDYEICVIDGSRGLGNRRLLPAGPLREPPDRLQAVDLVLINGPQQAGRNMTVAGQDAEAFELVATNACRLNDSLVRPLRRFSGSSVHAVAGIGNPTRFFEMLRRMQLQVVEHAFRDHSALAPADLEFGDELPVFMTEKDAVKLGTRVDDKFWYVPVELHMIADLALPIIERIESRLGDRTSAA